MQNTYSNKDFYLSAYLVAEGFELIEYSRENGFTTFSFENSNELIEAMRKYHSLSAKTEPVKYGNAIKSLKTLIHSEQISNSKSNNNYVKQNRNNN
ncbi:MAG: DUF5659 domain-containing protein [bacterium]